MAHHYTASLMHAWHHFYEGMKKFSSGHAGLFDSVAEKTVEAGVIVVAAGLLYKVTQILYASNSAHQVYAAGLKSLHVAHQIYSNALLGLM